MWGARERFNASWVCEHEEQRRSRAWWDVEQLAEWGGGGGIRVGAQGNLGCFFMSVTVGLTRLNANGRGGLPTYGRD